MGHAYYEFQHVELAGVGNGKKRFAISHGGPSQGLFAEDVKQKTEERPRVRNPPGGHASNIFGPPEETTPQRSGRNRMTSTIHLGDTVDSPASSTTSSPPDTPLKSDAAESFQAGDQPRTHAPAPARRPMSPNPVTGEGYEITPEKKPAVVTPQPQMQTPRRRVPPGGFSSPLW